jgi:hypothetical protein
MLEHCIIPPEKVDKALPPAPVLLTTIILQKKLS